MIIRIILWTLLAYFIYKFVFDFLLPLIKVSRQMKRQVKDFHRFAQQQQEQQAQPQADAGNGAAAAQEKEKTGEYIDFEEIKEKKQG